MSAFDNEVCVIAFFATSCGVFVDALKSLWYFCMVSGVKVKQVEDDGDIIFIIGDSKEIALNALGALRAHLGSSEGLCDTSKFNPQYLACKAANVAKETLKYQTEQFSKKKEQDKKQ